MVFQVGKINPIATRIIRWYNAQLQHSLFDQHTVMKPTAYYIAKLNTLPQRRHSLFIFTSNVKPNSILPYAYDSTISENVINLLGFNAASRRAASVNPSRAK